jgi:hypothetical protein
MSFRFEAATLTKLLALACEARQSMTAWIASMIDRAWSESTEHTEADTGQVARCPVDAGPAKPVPRRPARRRRSGGRA